MQIVAALAKVFSRRKVQTVWWHHHVPWYLSPQTKIKSFIERYLIVPLIDQMVATSHFVAQKVREYCGRDSVVIHPILSSKYHVLSSKTGTETAPHLNTEYLIPDTAPITLFTHGRLEAGKGLDMLTRVFDKLV